MKKSLVLLSSALLIFGLASCGDKDAASSAPKVEAGETVPPPAGKSWSEVVVQTESGGFLMGNPNAKIQVTEFASFTCPHCRDFAAESEQDVRTMVDTGKMSFELRRYARDPLDMTAALLAACNGPEAFFPLAHQLFANQEAMYEKVQAAAAQTEALMQKPSNERLIGLAELAGLIEFVKQRGMPEAKARQCLSDLKQVEAIAKQVEADNSEHDITGTPTVLLNNEIVENGAQWQVVKAKLKEAGL